MLKREGEPKNSQKRDVFNLHIWNHVGSDKIEIALLQNVTQKLVAYQQKESKMNWNWYFNVCNIIK